MAWARPQVFESEVHSRVLVDYVTAAETTERVARPTKHIGDLVGAGVYSVEYLKAARARANPGDATYDNQNGWKEAAAAEAAEARTPRSP